jgi:hypothetical protein
MLTVLFTTTKLEKSVLCQKVFTCFQFDCVNSTALYNYYIIIDNNNNKVPVVAIGPAVAVADGPGIAVAEVAAVVLQWAADCPEADTVQECDCYGRTDLKPAGLLLHHQPSNQKSIEEGKAASKNLAIFFLCPSKKFLLLSFKIQLGC